MGSSATPWAIRMFLQHNMDDGNNPTWRLVSLRCTSRISRFIFYYDEWFITRIEIIYVCRNAVASRKLVVQGLQRFRVAIAHNILNVTEEPICNRIPLYLLVACSRPQKSLNHKSQWKPVRDGHYTYILDKGFFGHFNIPTCAIKRRTTHVSAQ